MHNTKKISGIIKTQFPEFYHEEGPVFINFVSAYYDWLESKTDQLNVLIKPSKMTITVVHGSANVVGYNTKFLTNFSNNDKIAITRSNTDYELFTINAISNDTFLTLSTQKLPKFAISNTTFGNVSSNPNPGYYVRRTQDSLDVDTTTNEFLVWFKETYLKNIQFNTITDTKTLVKHSLDLYRSKGTPRSDDLLFKIAFGVPAEVYYPSQDLFNTSQGIWHIPKYLELAPNKRNVLLENKEIIGLTSGAIAFCDAVVRKTVKGRFIDVAYISAINGNFQIDEHINSTDTVIDITKSPLTIGSLNEAIVLSGGFGYSIGEIVDIYSNGGEQALGRVANVVSSVGSIDFSLMDGGYAYTANAQVLISNNIITLSNLQANTLRSSYFEDFETISQPMANISYSGANGTPTIGDFIYTYYANNVQRGFGQIFGIQAINSSAGEFEAFIRSGNLNSTPIYTTSNSIVLTMDSYNDKTVTGNAVGRYANVTLSLTNISGTFTNSEIIYQTPDAGGGINSKVTNIIGSNGTMFVGNSNGVFDSTHEILGLTSGATANISDIAISVGIKDVGNTSFIITPNNFITSDLTKSGINATSTFVSKGSGLSFGFSNNFTYTENIDLNSDLISTYLSVALNAVSYNFPADISGNLTSNTIQNLLSFSNTTIGRIETLTNISKGTNYNAIPVVRFYDTLTKPLNKPDTKIITITDSTTDFDVGEEITQSATSFRGLVKSTNSTQIVALKLRWDDSKDVINTTNTSTQLVGINTGATANVTSAIDSPTSEILGNDVSISFSLAAANGVINELEIIDSGYGFIQGEEILWGSNSITGTAVANLVTHGTGRGFYKSHDSFLSNVKKIQDGEYWQTHSYEVRSSVNINKYAKMLKEVVHVAGLGVFGNLVYTSITNAEISFANSGENSVISK